MAQHTSSNTRVCLLIDGCSLSWWQADALEYLLETTDVELTTIVYNEYSNTRSKFELLKRGIELREWAIVSALNNWLISSNHQADAVEIDRLVDLETVTELSVEPNIVDGWKQEIPEQDVSTIATTSDVAIRFGFGFLVGPILTELEHGVLSYHHGDLREYRGQPMGFWEFVNEDDTAGITVQRLTEDLDAGNIAAIKTIPIDDVYTWEAVKHRLFVESKDMLATAITSIQDGTVEEPAELGTVYTLPRGLPVFKFLVKNTKGHILDQRRDN